MHTISLGLKHVGPLIIKNAVQFSFCVYVYIVVKGPTILKDRIVCILGEEMCS